MIFDDYDDSYDIKQLQRLPMYQGMTEKEVRIVLHRILALETKQWEDEVQAMMADQRKKTMEYIAKLEKEDGYEKRLSRDPVQIQWGITVAPDMVDDKGFVPSDVVTNRRKTLKLFIDDKRKIYIGK